jgi:hypothetical protein
VKSSNLRSTAYPPIVKFIETKLVGARTALRTKIGKQRQSGGDHSRR